MDFRESFLQRTALLAGQDEALLDRVWNDHVRLTPGVEPLIGELKRRGIKTAVITSGFDFFAVRLQRRLGLDYSVFNTLEITDGRLTGKILGPLVDARGKGDGLRRIRRALGLARGQTMAVGDGANDVGLLAEAGVGIAYHGKAVLRRKARYNINFVAMDGLLRLFSP